MLAALTVQQHSPLGMELNAELIAQSKDHPEVQQAALRNYAFDTEHDHSATLRKLWAILPQEATKARYNCLYAMGVHPQGNDSIALEAVETDAYDFIDVAMPVLATPEANPEATPAG